MIKPKEGCGLGYIDFSSQEMGIAAGLSGDERLIEAYNAGDPYLAFAKQAGLIPVDATRDSHAIIRDQCKVVVLGLNYGLGSEKMAYQAGNLNCSGDRTHQASSRNISTLLEVER